ncbi:MAG: hypothetical protein AAB731_00320 [Patescibacteria group bacterium]
MPSKPGKYQGINYEIFTPADPTASYKKMVILGYAHLSSHDLVALIAQEFAGMPLSRVQIEVLSHRGLTIKG